MISVEVEGKDLVMDMSRDSGASTVIRKMDGQIRVEVANGRRACAWSFQTVVRSKAIALRDIRADMETALRRVGLSAPPDSTPDPVFVEQVLRTPRGLSGAIGDQIRDKVSNQVRDAIAKRVGKPAETEQPEVAFPHVEIPEKKVLHEISALRRRIDAIEREMASKKQTAG